GALAGPGATGDDHEGVLDELRRARIALIARQPVLAVLRQPHRERAVTATACSDDGDRLREHAPLRILEPHRLAGDTSERAGGARALEPSAEAREPGHRGRAPFANSNDLRRFLYDWFTHFELTAPTDFYPSHLANENLHLRFPGSSTITSHADFVAWYENLLAQPDSYLDHHFIRRTWTITVGDRPVIQSLVAAGGDSPSPIARTVLSAWG